MCLGMLLDVEQSFLRQFEECYILNGADVLDMPLNLYVKFDCAVDIGLFDKLFERVRKVYTGVERKLVDNAREIIILVLLVLLVLLVTGKWM